MPNWDKTKGAFKETYENAKVAAEIAKEEYKRRIKSYTREAEKYGTWLKVDNSGGGHNDDMDAFRHAYTSAKVAKEHGQTVATSGGIFHEVKGQTQDIFSSDPRDSQPLPESIMDEHNNSIGRELGARAREEGWSNARLAEEVKKALDEGKLIRQPAEGPEIPGYPRNPEEASRSSILDYFGNAVNQAGQAIATAGRVTFDIAMGLGKETLQQALQLAMTQGGNKETLKQAAQLAMGQMLASMHAATMERVAQLAMPGGYAGPLKSLVQDSRIPIEDYMNNPSNQGVFDKLVEEVQRLLGVYPDLNPTTVLVDRGLDKVRSGAFKLPHEIMLPNLPTKGGKGEQNISIFGMQLPILMPEIEIIGINPNAEPIVVGGAAESPHVSIERGGNGAIQVRSYTRSGATVRSHTRSRPDDEVSNNLSFRSKA
jgi:hypothetical protein